MSEEEMKKILFVFICVLFLESQLFSDSKLNMQVSSFKEILEVKTGNDHGSIHLHLIEYSVQDTDKVILMKDL